MDSQAKATILAELEAVVEAPALARINVDGQTPLVILRLARKLTPGEIGYFHDGLKYLEERTGCSFLVMGEVMDVDVRVPAEYFARLEHQRSNPTVSYDELPKETQIEYLRKGEEIFAGLVGAMLPKRGEPND